jgi:hypothetical protein
MSELDRYRSYYACATDAQLEERLCDLTELVPEALVALRDELAGRGFSAGAEAVDVQVAGVSSQQLAELVAWVQAGPCPACGETGRPVDAVAFESRAGSETVVGCTPCLEETVRADRLARTAGCLAIMNPLHAVFTGAALRRAASRLAEAKRSEPSPVLRDFVHRHQGPLTAARRRGASPAARDWLDGDP